MRKAVLYLTLVLGVLSLTACSSDSSSGSDQRAEKAPATASNPNSEVEQGRSEHPDALRILFLGDSITAAYGLDERQGFVHLVGERLDSVGIPATVINAGVSGDTSTGGLNRLDWLLNQGLDILVLELGGNDGLRGIDVDLTRSNLAAIIERTRSTSPQTDIILAGMQVPPNLGQDYTRRFRSMYSELAAEYDTHLIPFILEGVGGNPELNLPDGIHPTAEGHRILANTVWDVLYPVARERVKAP
jgi:acyl-CoA thioesterase-1